MEIPSEDICPQRHQTVWKRPFLPNSTNPSNNRTTEQQNNRTTEQQNNRTTVWKRPLLPNSTNPPKQNANRNFSLPHQLIN